MRRQSFAGALVTFGLFMAFPPGALGAEPSSALGASGRGTAVSAGTAGSVAAGAQDSPGLHVGLYRYGEFPGAVGSFSPNGDRIKDRARFRLTLDRPATVTMTVKAWNGHAWRRVRRDRLGLLRQGGHAWHWDGRNEDGRRVADGRYFVKVRGRAGSSGSTATTDRVAWVDTVYRPGRLEVSDGAVYPNTVVTTDRIWFGSSLAGDADPVTQGTLRISTLSDKLKYSVTSRAWDNNLGESPRRLPVGWDGRGNDGQVLKAGRYSVRLFGTDEAGNSGASPKDFTVLVSATPLVEASGMQAVTPAATLQPLPDYCAGPGIPPNGCGDFIPCGSVAPSTAYADPEALSYRSAVCDTSPNSLRNYAIGNHALTLDVSAPRGIAAVRVAMRGRPTITGETDTARLGVFGVATTSAATTGESVTTSPFVNNFWWQRRYLPHPPVLGWAVETIGFDSYDVAGFTVEYKYLTPQD